MKKYVIAFIVAMIVSSTFVNFQFPASKMPAGIADMGTTSLGVWKRREGVIPEIKITDSYRRLRFITEINDRNENRDADSPGIGNN